MATSVSTEPMVFVDLETTGANFANDRIIEIGIVTVDGEKASEWSSLVNPGQDIPPFITGLTGIDSAMTEPAPCFAELASEVFDKLRGRLFIAHNARFDYTFLKREFARVGIPFRAQNLCTVKFSRRLFPEHHRHSLDALVARHHIVVDDRHRALADARVLWDLWQTWQNEVPQERFERELAQLAFKPSLPPQLDPSIVDDLPEAHGAYAFYASDGRILQLKRVANLRQQILGQFAASNQNTPLVREIGRIEWRESAGEFGAKLHEHLLHAALSAQADQLCTWQLAPYAPGDYRPSLVFAHDVDFARTPNLFGLYKTRREAVTALRRLAEAHHLCLNHLGIGAGKADQPCVGFRQRTCRGVCAGKEAASLHSARLMAALAKYKIQAWPYEGPIALVERDEFGMREDFHLFDQWQFLGTFSGAEAATARSTEHRQSRQDAPEPFDSDLYRLVSKAISTGKLRLVAL